MTREEGRRGGGAEEGKGKEEKGRRKREEGEEEEETLFTEDQRRQLCGVHLRAADSCQHCAHDTNSNSDRCCCLSRVIVRRRGHPPVHNTLGSKCTGR
eukprot:2502215-Rhodomonas_salina.1